MALAVVRDKARKRGISTKLTGCRKPRWFAAACKRHREVTAFFNPATIEKQKGKAKDALLLSTLNSPSKDYFSILVMKLIVSNC
ncbi:MAG: hypothetical protein M3436_10250 [Pseudomonadota bacterium]|nr:hypothetical protein [Pseudomonadota bacterium]